MSKGRDTERAILERCRQIATTPGDTPSDHDAGANVCRLAGMNARLRYADNIQITA